MSLPTPSSTAQQYINEAAAGTGLPASVVQAQLYIESGYGSNVGPSSAGAQGPWQFLPSTYTGLGFKAGTENNWADETEAYIQYMQSLLKTYNGNVSKALAAYNAGGGNLAAGASYASNILSLAGQKGSLTVSAGGAGIAGASASGSAATGPNSTASSLSLIPGLDLSAITDVFTTIETILKDIVQPSFWMRIGAFLAGMTLLILGIWALTRAPDNGSLAPDHVPVPVPV